MKHVEALIEKWTVIASECEDVTNRLYISGCIIDLKAALAEDAKTSICTTNIDE